MGHGHSPVLGLLGEEAALDFGPASLARFAIERVQLGGTGSELSGVGAVAGFTPEMSARGCVHRDRTRGPAARKRIGFGRPGSGEDRCDALRLEAARDAHAGVNEHIGYDRPRARPDQSIVFANWPRAW